MKNKFPENSPDLIADNAPEDIKTLGQEVKTKQSFKINRNHEFSHTHPSHARHKQFGMDHEPGTF